MRSDSSYRQDLNFFPSHLCLSKTTFGEMGYGVHDRQSTLSLKLVGDESDHDDVIQSHAGGGGGGSTKLCVRGHWRPAEDSKLKELVAQIGPQNWNLIAEHLDGRSIITRPDQTSYLV